MSRTAVSREWNQVIWHMDQVLQSRAKKQKKMLREIITETFLNQMKIKLIDPRSSMNPKHKKHEANFIKIH